MSYAERKEKARQEAIEWQNDLCNHDYFMSELAAFADYFGKQAKRYGLTKEFRENGII